jgi:hypothetical protein
LKKIIFWDRAETKLKQIKINLADSQKDFIIFGWIKSKKPI